ncbi:MAG: AMP-binding protein, partial [Gammaproteobacteria bacterium]
MTDHRPDNSTPLQVWPRRVPHEIPLLETTLWYNLEVSARRYRDKTALIFFGKTIDYAELKTRAERLAGWLQRDAGVQAGDRVLLMMQNSPQFVIATYAIMRADAVVVPVNPMSRAEELSHYIADSGSRVAICAADLVAHVEGGNALLDEAQRLRHLLVTRYVDCMPAVLEDAEQPPAAWTKWLAADPELP